MSTLAAVVLFIGILGYAVFGGADFGAGFWDLIAGGTHRGGRPRAVIDHSIAPVWEANHVWLIFVFVVLWTSFPEAYASITLTLFVPLTIAAFGIVLRGVELRVPQVGAVDARPPDVRGALRRLVGDRPVLLRRRSPVRSPRAVCPTGESPATLGTAGSTRPRSSAAFSPSASARISPPCTSCGTPDDCPTTRWSSTSGSEPSARPSSPAPWRSPASSCCRPTPSTCSTG